MTNDSNIVKRNSREALAVERRRILGLAPEKALAAITEHPYPVTLVQSFKEEDLYLLVHTIGLDDALPVLALASNDQWEYFMDMETWSRDHLDQTALTRWMDLLLKADPDRFTHWITHEKIAQCELYLFRNIEVRIREHDQDPSDFGDDFFTAEGTFYVRPLKASPEEPGEGGPSQQERELFIIDLLKRLSIYDPILYRGILLEAQALIPAEMEEDHYRLRNVRLAEKGFLPFEEAIGVYQPLSVHDLLQRSRKPSTVPGGRLLDAHPLRVDRIETQPDANLFTRTLAQLQDEPELQRLQAEFAGLCNQIIAADQRRIRDKEGLSRVVRKTGDYISIGMEKVAAEKSGAEGYEHANLIRTYLLADIFRVGYGCALALKWEAEKWRRGSWFAATGLPLSFWGETWMGLLGGLLIKKPLYYDNYAHGVLYREFSTLADIGQTRAVLETIRAFDDLLALMGIEVRPGAYKFLTYQNLLLTLWANHMLGIAGRPKTPQPLTLEQFRSLFDRLWEDDGKLRRISDPVKELFLGWLSQRGGISALDISERMGRALEQLFGDIEAELREVDPAHLDPRHIYLFLFEKKKSK